MTPEQTIRHALADLALIAPELERLLARANGSMPGPGAATEGGGTVHSTPDVEQRAADEWTEDQRQLAKEARLTRDEARAVHGPDMAERDIREALSAVVWISRNVQTIHRCLAPYRPRHKPFDPNDVPKGWCPNCYRLADRRHSPTKHKRDGVTLEWSDGWCQFCGRFRAANGWLPNRRILAQHFGVGNVTQTLIDSEYRKLSRKAQQDADDFLNGKVA